MEEVAEDDDEAGLYTRWSVAVGGNEQSIAIMTGQQLTWMMKMIMGSLGLYSDGLEPSTTPAWEGARSPSSAVPPALASSVATVDMVVPAVSRVYRYQMSSSLSVSSRVLSPGTGGWVDVV